MADTTNETMNALFRTHSATAARESQRQHGEITAMANDAIEAGLHALSTLHAIIDELQNGTDESPDGEISTEIDVDYSRCVDSFGELISEVDALLDAHGLPMTHAAEHAAQQPVEE